MKLKSFGCSFMFGSDMADTHLHSALYPRSSRSTWTAHLASHLNYHYLCYAKPGSGNTQIMERVLSQAATNEHALFVIGWTWIDRFDYVNSDDPTYRWQSIMPVDTTDISKVYYRDLHSEYRDKLSTLANMRLVIDVLKDKGCPFLMTYMDELTFDKTYNTTPAVTDLQDYVQPYMTRWEDKNFLQWCRKYGYPESSTQHPLEDAHRAAGDYMIKVFDTKNISDPTQQALS